MIDIQTLFRLLQNGNNPFTMINAIIQEQSKTNPLMKTVETMLNQGNTQGIETIVRNVCSEKGLNADMLLKTLQQQFTSR